MEQEDEKTGRFEDGSAEVIGACIEVHRHLGPGLLESIYEHCLAHEITMDRAEDEGQDQVMLLSERCYRAAPPYPLVWVFMMPPPNGVLSPLCVIVARAT